MTTLSYEIVDVFTDRPFAGNPLAVVFGADRLARDQLQALAREFHLSETVFVLPPTQPGATYRARIFTPVAELPFAGHPSVGVAVTQLRRGIFPAGVVYQECGAGVLPVEVFEDGRATLTGGPPTAAGPLDPAGPLAAVGLTAADLAGPPPSRAGCGISFTYLGVRPDAVARATAGGAIHGEDGGVCVFSWDAHRRESHARVFVGDLGVPEDPATGSAALGFGVWLVAVGLLPGDGKSSYVVRQGAELHRPSTMDCTVTAAAGVARSATVSGHVVPIATGHIATPPFIG